MKKSETIFFFKKEEKRNVKKINELMLIKVTQRCCGTPARMGKNLVRNTQKRQKIVRNKTVFGDFCCLWIAKTVRNFAVYG